MDTKSRKTTMKIKDALRIEELVVNYIDTNIDDVIEVGEDEIDHLESKLRKYLDMRRSHIDFVKEINKAQEKDLTN